MGVFDNTIIPLALLGYEMIIANLYPMRTCGIIVKYLFKISFQAQLEATGIVNILMKTSMSASQLQQYLENPPVGMTIIFKVSFSTVLVINYSETW